MMSNFQHQLNVHDHLVRVRSSFFIRRLFKRNSQTPHQLPTAASITVSAAPFPSQPSVPRVPYPSVRRPAQPSPSLKFNGMRYSLCTCRLECSQTIRVSRPFTFDGRTVLLTSSVFQVRPRPADRHGPLPRGVSFTTWS